MVRFVAFLDPDKTLEGKLNSDVEVISWDFDEGSGIISDPRVDLISVSHVIPTKFEKNLARSIEKIEKTVVDYKSNIKKRFEKQIKELELKVNSKKEGTKSRQKLEEKKAFFEDFLKNIDKNIYLNGPFGRGSYKTYHLITPSLS